MRGQHFRGCGAGVPTTGPPPGNLRAGLPIPFSLLLVGTSSTFGFSLDTVLRSGTTFTLPMGNLALSETSEVDPGKTPGAMGTLPWSSPPLPRSALGPAACRGNSRAPLAPPLERHRGGLERSTSCGRRSPPPAKPPPSGGVSHPPART